MNYHLGLDVASYGASYFDYLLPPVGSIVSQRISCLNYALVAVETVGYGIRHDYKEFWRGVATLSGAIVGGIYGGYGGAYFLSSAFSMGYSYCYDPLIIDLDNDGDFFININDSKIFFDMNSDGKFNTSTWFDADDGLFVLDLNMNGNIDNLGEVFSEKFNGGCDSGFGALLTLDQNNDGIFNLQDDAFYDVRVWRDFNQNGISEENELHSLASLNISSIDLSNIVTAERNIAGNVIYRESSVTMTNGDVTTVADVGFLVNSGEYTYEGSHCN
jgi:hypothetical protein